MYFDGSLPFGWKWPDGCSVAAGGGADPAAYACATTAAQNATIETRAKARRAVMSVSGQREAASERAGTWLMAYSVMAVIVSDGFTPGLAGTVEPSQTRKSWYP